MGFVSGLLGTAGGAGGTGFSGPQSANLMNPASSQMGTDALKQQQDLINAYQPGGTAALASQQALLGQLGQAAQGQGPNPALAQLAQATQANTANQAALMAGQRGSSSNPALIARQAAMQGAQNQQNAAGEAATLSAQQQIQARQALAQQQQQMVNQQQAGQQQYTGNVLGQIQSQNNNAVGMQSNVNNANAGLAQGVMGQQGQLLGNVAGGVGMAMGMPMKAEGGMITPHNMPVMYADGTDQVQAPPAPLHDATSGPKSKIGQFFSNMNDPSKPQGMGLAGNVIGQGIGKGLNALFGSSGSQPMAASIQPGATGGLSNDSMKALQNPDNFAEGGKVPALVSPGEQYIPPKDVKAVKEGKKDPLKTGERIPGKPKHPGNDYRNDTVKRNLDEGGVVIPNSIMQGPNPHWEAMRFVHAHTRSLKKNK